MAVQRPLLYRGGRQPLLRKRKKKKEKTSIIFSDSLSVSHCLLAGCDNGCSRPPVILNFSSKDSLFLGVEILLILLGFREELDYVGFQSEELDIFVPYLNKRESKTVQQNFSSTLFIEVYCVLCLYVPPTNLFCQTKTIKNENDDYQILKKNKKSKSTKIIKHPLAYWRTESVEDEGLKTDIQKISKMLQQI